jgi:hypothetical protein
MTIFHLFLKFIVAIVIKKRQDIQGLLIAIFTKPCNPVLEQPSALRLLWFLWFQQLGSCNLCAPQELGVDGDNNGTERHHHRTDSR